MALNLANSVGDSWYRLDFLTFADMLNANWITLNELYQYGDDAAQWLARDTSLFLTYDQSITVIAGTAKYALPPRHIFTEAAWLTGGAPAVQQLRLTTAGQLFALDALWPTRYGTPTRFSLDAVNVDTGILYPIPVSGATLNQVIEQAPVPVTSGTATLPISPILEMYFTDWLIAGALSRESDSARPEVAKHLIEKLHLLDSVITQLWG